MASQASIVVVNGSRMPAPNHDQLRYELRAAQHKLRHNEGLLAARHQARERARGERYAAQAAVAEAEQMLAEVRKHSRADLVEAYINNEPVDAAMTEADAKTQLELRTDQLRHAEEIDRALTFEIADLESNVIPEHRRRRDQAAGALVSRTAQFLALVRRVDEAFATLRNVRLCLEELRRLVPHGDTLCPMIDSNQPSGAGRWGGFGTGEKLVSEWTNAVGKLLVDGDSLVPGDNSKLDRADGSPSSSPVRGGPRPPRQRGQRPGTPSGRPARRKRAEGKRGSSRASRPARNRDPAPGITTSGINHAAKVTDPPSRVPQRNPPIGK